MMTHILAVDDDPQVLGTLERVLLREQFTVSLARDGSEALDYLENNELPDLVILDIIMPNVDGLTVCERLRRDKRFISLPILFLTAKGSTDDVVDGLDAGADDYVVKPFELAELRARVHALLRRGIRNKTGEAAIEIPGLKLDSDTYSAITEDTEVQLTATEHRLLRYMLENTNQALSLSQLLQAVWEYPSDAGDPDLVRAHIRNLRSKIETTGGRRFIRTIHGVGYMIST